MLSAGICELTRDLGAGAGSVYFEDPMGNVLEVWDFFADPDEASPRVGERASWARGSSARWAAR